MIKRGKVESGGISRIMAELNAPGFSGLVHLDCPEGDAHLRIRDGRIISARVHHDIQHNPIGRRSREGASAIREIEGWQEVEYTCESATSTRDPFDPRDGIDIRDMAASA